MLSWRHRASSLTRSVLAGVLLLALLLTACTPDDDQDKPVLLVGVAASIQPVAAELATRFEAEHEASVTLVTGASGMLAEQLRQGAPLDLIISADSRYTSALASDGLLDPMSITVLATGELVAITNLDDQADDIASLVRSTAVRQVAIANPEIAPHGEAAERFLRSAGLWEEVADRVVYGGNVAHAYQFVASGNAELGFVPHSLVIASDAQGVRALAPLPPEASASLQVTAGVSVETGAADMASRFIASMSVPPALETWRQFGYASHIGKVDGAE